MLNRGAVFGADDIPLTESVEDRLGSVVVTGIFAVVFGDGLDADDRLNVEDWAVFEEWLSLFTVLEVEGLTGLLTEVDSSSVDVFGLRFLLIVLCL